MQTTMQHPNTSYVFIFCGQCLRAHVGKKNKVYLDCAAVDSITQRFQAQFWGYKLAREIVTDVMLIPFYLQFQRIYRGAQTGHNNITYHSRCH
jgi:hypothetical protein